MGDKTLRDILKDRNIKQSVVADALGIQVTHLGRYDDLSRRSIEEVLKISQATGIELSELLGPQIGNIISNNSGNISSGNTGGQNIVGQNATGGKITNNSLLLDKDAEYQKIIDENGIRIYKADLDALRQENEHLKTRIEDLKNALQAREETIQMMKETIQIMKELNNKNKN